MGLAKGPISIMIPNPIKTDQEYYLALKELDKVFDASANTPEGRKAEILVNLIEEFEDKYYPVVTNNAKPTQHPKNPPKTLPRRG